jgi:3-methylcrotonyl-CoA carboxylase beta subunit
VTRLPSNASPGSESFRSNRNGHLAMIAEVAEAAAQAIAGGGDKARERHLARGKILPRERVARLLDPGSPFLEVGLFAAHGLYDGASPCAGLVAGIGRVEGRVGGEPGRAAPRRLPQRRQR